MNAQRLVLDEWNTKPNKIIFWLNNRSNRIRVQVLRTQGLGKSRIKLAEDQSVEPFGHSPRKRMQSPEGDDEVGSERPHHARLSDSSETSVIGDQDR